MQLFSPNIIRNSYRTLSTPICRINPFGNKSVNGRIGPFRRGIDQTMFYRVEMDIIAVAVEIPIIPNLMLPESPLPDHSFMALFLRFLMAAKQLTYLLVSTSPSLRIIL